MYEYKAIVPSASPLAINWFFHSAIPSDGQSRIEAFCELEKDNRAVGLVVLGIFVGVGIAIGLVIGMGLN